uniref:4-coumarate--CoA ligase n=1 Tax=Leersia perrieri TaxID=77586 RepID=A0A0D9XR83_9ORYZ
MSPPPADVDVDPRSGYSTATGTYHSLRPPPPHAPPPPSHPLSFPDFAFSSFSTSLPTTRPALIDSATGDAVTFPAFLSRVRALAAALLLGVVSPGDVAFVLAPPGVHVPVLYYALMAVGAVVSPADPALTQGEISRLVEMSSPTVAFAVSDTAGKLPCDLRVVLLDAPDFLSCHGVGVGEAAVAVRQSDPAAILYSSGTTGRAKAVLLTHRNLIASAAMPVTASASAAAAAAAANVVILLAVPMFHIYGFMFCLRAAMAGQTLVVYTGTAARGRGRFDARAVLAAVARFRVTRVAMAPPSVLAIVRAAEEDGSVTAGTASLQAVNCGGASISPDLIRRFSRKFPGVSLSQGYGMTETTAGFCRAVGEEESGRTGSVGRLSWGAEAKIVDPTTGDALPPGVPGELWVRGPFVMKGYLGDKESTSAILDSEGWLRTGDLCSFDKDGFLYIVDRLKELIKCKGYQVAPAELEHLLQTHPDIVEAAVVPFPDDQAGELPLAFVVRRAGGNLNAEQIKEFVAKQVVHYKRIHHVCFVNTIPKNSGGKILRKELVKLALHRRSNL